jgi:hypothetical protein
MFYKLFPAAMHKYLHAVSCDCQQVAWWAKKLTFKNIFFSTWWRYYQTFVVNVNRERLVVADLSEK